MAIFRVELRGAKPTNGHTGEPAITTAMQVEARDWFSARQSAARRYGIDPMDPAMFAIRKGGIERA